MATEEFDRDEPTGRTKRIDMVEVDAAAALKLVKRVRFWGQIAFGVLLAVATGVFAGANYLNTLAKASTVDRHTRHIAVIEARQDWFQAQLIEIARQVNARMIPPPAPVADAGVDNER